MILLLLGTDGYRKRERRQAAIAEFGVKPDDVVHLDSDSVSVQTLDDSILSLGLFATKRVVFAPSIVSDAPKNVKERLVKVLPSVGDETLLILDEEKLDLRLELTKVLKKIATIEPFDPMHGPALERWVGDIARTFGVTIEPPARTELVARIGDNSWQLVSELQKLAAAAMNENPPRITVPLVKSLTTSSVDVSSFALTDAIAAGNAAKARVALMKLAQQGEEPIRIMGLLAYHLRTLAQVKDAYEVGHPPKLSPFVAKKLTPSARATSWRKLAHWYERLAEYDWQVKTGRIDADVALELLLHALTSEK